MPLTTRFVVVCLKCGRRIDDAIPPPGGKRVKRISPEPCPECKAGDGQGQVQ